MRNVRGFLQAMILHSQVDKSCFADVVCDELGCQSDRSEEEGEVTGCLRRVVLVFQDVAGDSLEICIRVWTF